MTKTLSITKAREDLTTLVDNVNKRLDEYVITVNGAPVAVLMSASEFESWKETTEILADPFLMEAIRKGEEDVKKGRVYDLKDVIKDLGVNVSTKNNSNGKKRA